MSAAFALVSSVLRREALVELELWTTRRARKRVSKTIRLALEPTRSFGSLADELARAWVPPRELAREVATPLPSPVDERRQGALAVVLGEAPPPTGSDLTLRLEPGLAELCVRERSSELSGSLLAACVERVLERVMSEPNARLGELHLLGPEERAQQLFAWNATQRAFPRGLRLHDPFERRATLAPGATALVFEDRSLTFAEVESAANRVANALVARGIGRGDRVGILLERGFELVIALLGVAKSGAAYVALDVSLPSERIKNTFEDAACSVLVTQRYLALGLDDSRRLLLESTEVTQAAEHRPNAPLQSSDACYVRYTSGSTGQPEGVVLTHRAVSNTLDWAVREFAVSSKDRVVFVMSPGSDLSVFDVFGALGAGASVEIAGASLLAEPSRLAAKLVEPGITLWNSAPAQLAALAPFLPARAPASTLRRVLLSRDGLPLSLLPLLRRTFPRAHVESLGGATETAIWSNHYPIREHDAEWRSVPYGRPIQNARYYVLDWRMQPPPVGVTGDLYIGGACLAEGYLNRPELTRERFLSDPFVPGERLYKTFELARFLPDGNIELMGRADRSFAREISPGRASERSREPVHLVALNRRGRRPPLVLVAGVGGHSFTYRALPRLLGPEQPVLSFIAEGADGESPQVELSIEEMAETYERELVRAVPRGPVVLGGFSFGALPALELAHRLVRSGRQVPLLVSFDGFAPQYPRRLPFSQRVAAHAAEFSAASAAERRRYLSERVTRVKERLFELAGKDASLAQRLPLVDEPGNGRPRQPWVHRCGAAKRYAPRFHLHADLLLIKAGKAYRCVAGEMDDPYYGWGAYITGRISTLTVPGEHRQLFSNENQERVARAVAEHMNGL